MKAARILKTQSGFSLIELMIVVAIIGILASIAVPNFQKFQRRAKQSEGKGYLTSLYTAEQGFKAEWNTFTSDLVCIGFRDNAVPAPAVGLAGKGAYRVGFGAESAAASLPADATCAAGRNVASPAPASGTTIPALVTTNVTVPTLIAFTAATTGQLGGTTPDTWTVDQNKLVTNRVSGL